MIVRSLAILNVLLMAGCAASLSGTASRTPKVSAEEMLASTDYQKQLREYFDSPFITTTICPLPGHGFYIMFDPANKRSRAESWTCLVHFDDKEFIHEFSRTQYFIFVRRDSRSDKPPRPITEEDVNFWAGAGLDGRERIKRILALMDKGCLARGAKGKDLVRLFQLPDAWYMIGDHASGILVQVGKLNGYGIDLVLDCVRANPDSDEVGELRGLSFEWNRTE